MKAELHDKSTALLAAALDLIAGHGFQATTTDRISRQAGVAAGTLFRYFKSKDDLILELYKHIKGNLVKEITAAANLDLPPADLLRQVWFLSAKALTRSRQEFLFLQQFYSSPYARLVPAEVKQSLLSPLSEVVHSAMKSGVLKPMPDPVFEMFFLEPILALARMHFLGEIELDGAMLAFVFECCWNAVKA